MLTSDALRLAAAAIEGDAVAARALPGPVGALSEAARPERSQSRLRDPIDLNMSRRLAALAGQVRAVAALAAGRRGGRRPAQPPAPPAHQSAAPAAAPTTWSNSGRPPALIRRLGRHALRLAVIVPLAALISRELPLSRGYWMVVAAATVLRPEFGATFTRGAERALGTGLGVAIAGGIAVGLHPAGA